MAVEPVRVREGCGVSSPVGAVGRDERVLVVAVVILVGVCHGPVELFGDRCEDVTVVRSRDDDPRCEALVVGRLDDEPRLAGANRRDTLVEDVRAFVSRVRSAQFEKSLRADAARKPEVVLDVCTLRDRRLAAVEDRRVEPLAGGEDGGRESGGPTADDRDVVIDRGVGIGRSGGGRFRSHISDRSLLAGRPR